MAPVVPPEPQSSAADYDDRTTAAVKAVFLEIGQILGSFQGSSPSSAARCPGCCSRTRPCATSAPSMSTGFDAEALGDGEYATLVEALMGNGYQQRQGTPAFPAGTPGSRSRRPRRDRRHCRFSDADRRGDREECSSAHR